MMTISTALLFVLALGGSCMVLAAWALWRRLQALTRQVDLLASQLRALPSTSSSATVPGSVSTRQPASSLLADDAPKWDRSEAGVQPVSSFPLITHQAAPGEAASDPREVDWNVARVASVTLAEPLVKVAAFTHGVRHALNEEQRMRVSATFRRELRRQHKLRRRQRVSRARAVRRSHASADGLGS